MLKKFLSCILVVVMVLLCTAVSAGAYNSDNDYSKMSWSGIYNPTDSYTVDANTPYAEDAIVACGGNLRETATLYFQAPNEWANKFNTFEGPDDDEPYMHVCIYWWGGYGSEWPNGSGVAWCGYQAHLVDKENRIYSAKVPIGDDGAAPVVIWNNGVNGGMNKSKEIFSYARQIADLNVEGLAEGDSNTLPEGTDYPEHEWDCDGLISIVNYDKSHAIQNPLTFLWNYSTDWYAYYGDGCYGNYTFSSSHFKSRIENCVNPEHRDSNGNHIDINAPGDEFGYIIGDFYLIGSVNGDNSGTANVHPELHFTESIGDQLELKNVRLTAGDVVKVARYNGGKAFTIYPDGVGREVTIDKTGRYDFYFKPYELGNGNYWYITPSFIGENLVGDADGDGEVTLMDVTEVQRFLSSMNTRADEETLMFADVDKNGILEITDATFIQRHLAGIEIPYEIG